MGTHTLPMAGRAATGFLGGTYPSQRSATQPSPRQYASLEAATRCKEGQYMGKGNPQNCPPPHRLSRAPERGGELS